MADLSFLKSLNKPIAILGLGVSGQAVANACVQSGLPFHAWDDNAETRARFQDKFTLADFAADLSAYAFLVPAAGIKLGHPVLQQAAAQKIQIQSDVDLLLQSAPDATVIGITGTNGKSTTTALVGHILQEAGKNVAIGGNIGHAACSLPSLGADSFYVLELSSYMLEISAYPVADIAVFLNITPDHLDWHGTMEKYSAAKEKIFRQRPNRPGQIKIYGHSMQREELELPELPEHPFLKGEHNAENITAAFAACRAAGLDDDTIQKHLMSFQGLPHRQKIVATFKDIIFVNDSKGTNPDATSKALASFDSIFWIAGGRATDEKLGGLEKYYPKIRKAYLIGEAADEFADLLKNEMPVSICGMLKNAVEQAFVDALNFDGAATILLSPACKSFDQYQNFEQRGDDFTAQVYSVLED
ncbi:MAG: UDP-N-acetylmuramoyl-L-alanine--D-glutamate ligase [Alphaproteobacteria bacterium]|nr:UDP-N-acetylmuramoyl-L-alanine--D-glutamate ligase [Alphaproteobacteria bacterium]